MKLLVLLASFVPLGLYILYKDKVKQLLHSHFASSTFYKYSYIYAFLKVAYRLSLLRRHTYVWLLTSNLKET